MLCPVKFTRFDDGHFQLTVGTKRRWTINSEKLLARVLTDRIDTFDDRIYC